MRAVSVADRPELAESVPGILAARWPRFVLEGHPGHDVDLAELALGQVPEHQVVLLDDADEPLGVGLSVPISWDGTAAGLPAGWDGAVTAAADRVRHRRTPTTVCALSITTTEAGAGRGLSVHLIEALKRTAARAGATRLVAPVRPIRAQEYPLIPLESYLRWRTRDGQVFDPWMRMHLRLGGTMMAVTFPSMTITGTVTEWQSWTGLELPGSGAFVIPGGLAPLLVDEDVDQGVYQEPNVWVVHHT